MRWIDIAIETANNLGGEIIYKNPQYLPELKKIAKREGKKYDDKIIYYTVAKAIEDYSSDSANYSENRDNIFSKKGTGHWSLRSEYRKHEVLNWQEYILQSNIDKTEKEKLIDCRIGQSDFRKKLIELWQGCSITRFRKTELLIASHIKPWSVANNEERLDCYNGLLLIPNFDKLFDLGYISFLPNTGDIKISNEISQNEYPNLGLHPKLFIKVRNETKKYLQYHYEFVFKG